jgi:hypothetical protein
MTSDAWTGGTCAFDPAASLNEPCPQNLMVSFVGPGLTTGHGTTTHPNSSFISVSGVPQARTSVSIKSRHESEDEDEDDDDGGVSWVNSTTVAITFHSVPPYLYDLRGKLPGADTYIAQPIRSITFGVSAAGQVPDPADDPISTDSTLFNGTCPVPTPANPGAPSLRQPAFDPPSFTMTFPGNGLYALHYYAQDCAGTKELKFKKVKGSWTTSFRTRTIGVDTTAPSVTELSLSPASASYSKGEKVTASFECTDASSGSGVVQCGKRHYGEGSTYQTGILTSTVDTSKSGKATFRVRTTDAAGNQSSASITYMVK